MYRVILATACAVSLAAPAAAQTGPADPHAGHGMANQAAPATASAPRNASLPPDANAAAEQLKTSPRHGEWVDIKNGTGPAIKSFVVYPERKDKAPVVIVIHEIFGMTDWVRGVADQLAKEGFIAIAPDFLSGKGPNGGGSDSLGDGVGTGDSHAAAGRYERDSRRGPCIRADDPFIEQEGGHDRILLGRPDQLPLCDLAAGAERGRLVLRSDAVRCGRVRKSEGPDSRACTAETTTA